VTTVGDLLSGCLRAVGIERCFGAALPEMPGIAIADPRLAMLLAEADGRLGPRLGAAFLPDQVLYLSSKPGAYNDVATVHDPGSIPDLIRDAALVGNLHSRAFHLDLDLDAPAPAGVWPAGLARGHHRPTTIEGGLPAGRAMVLAGPGVLRADAVDGLRALAACGNVPVANTWGAKGVFAWDSPFHMGTAGLQARDFELLGFDGADLIVTTGLDADESPRSRYALAPVVDIAPEELGALAAVLRPSPIQIRPNHLYSGLAAVSQPGYVSEHMPMHPARAVADVRRTLPPDGIVAADPGLAGLWVARTFPTTRAGSVIVPATPTPGIATAIAFAAGLRGHHAIAITDAPVNDETRAVVALAKQHGVPIVVEVWGTGGHVHNPEDHLARLQAAFDSRGVSVIGVPIDAAKTQRLIDVAGDVVAWGGLR
jgi:hypothetical protein